MKETPFDDKGNDAVRGKVDAETPEQQAISDACGSLGRQVTPRGHKFGHAPTRHG